jgi:hypothetical protein
MRNFHTAFTFLVSVGVVLYSGDPSEGSRISPWRSWEKLCHQASIEYSMLPSDLVQHKSDFLEIEVLRVKKQRFTSILRIRGGMEGGKEDNVGWGNVDMNAADDELDLGAQGAEQEWPEQVRQSSSLLLDIIFLKKILEHTIRAKYWNRWSKKEARNGSAHSINGSLTIHFLKQDS